MAEAAIRKPSTPTWALGTPWPWLGLGSLLILLALAWNLLLPDSLVDAQVLLVFFGVLLAAIGVTVALNTSDVPGEVQRPHPLRSFSLLVLFGLAALALTLILVLSLVGISGFPFKPGQSLFVWCLAAPLFGVAAWTTQQRGVGAARRHQAAGALVAAAVCSYLAVLALHSSAEPTRWDSIQTLLIVLAGAAFFGAGLTMVSTPMRRAVVSLAIVLHFGGICSAVLSAPPQPWLVGQVWLRIYRPYLEFMYLNNAYHFYAPEPGPSSYLWFRLVYADSQGQTHGRWYKLPKMNERGRSQHGFSLEYQRTLALTEGTVVAEPTPPTVIIDEKSQYQPAPFYVTRLRHMPNQQIIVGEPAPKVAIPLHPFIPHLQQYSLPSQSTQLLLSSIARHVCHRFEQDPENADWRLVGVKIYRVTHTMATDAELRLGMDPRDPVLYRPYYMGMYDQDGKLLDSNDPFLYWLVPILRKDPNNLYSEIINYAYYHAGDRQHVRPATVGERPTSVEEWSLPAGEEQPRLILK